MLAQISVSKNNILGENSRPVSRIILLLIENVLLLSEYSLLHGMVVGERAIRVGRANDRTRILDKF
jgi:hypothetical protein